jgi:4-hydroxy-L-threonine phosphate dehydrogenase PdxA
MTYAIANNLISDPRPRLAFLLGDCTGIGPELVAKILHQRRMAEHARLVVVGDARVLELGMRDAKVDFPWRRVANTAAEIDWTSEVVPLIDLGNIDPANFPQGVARSMASLLRRSTSAQCMMAAGVSQTSTRCLRISSVITAISVK